MTPTLQTLVSLDRFHCHTTAELLGSDEPYLWTAFVKVDGDTVVLDLIGDGPDAALTWTTCCFAAAAASWRAREAMETLVSAMSMRARMWRYPPRSVRGRWASSASL